MKPLLTTMIFVIALTTTAQEPAAEETAVPPAFDTFWFVFLQSGETRSQDEAEAAEIQKAHLAHLKTQMKAGKMHVAGPFEAGPEFETRGICIYRGDLTREEVVAITEADPAVAAGRLRVEVVKWWVPEGVIKFEPISY